MMMRQVLQSELKNILVEASHALAHLDAGRLEEMALSCASLVRDVDRDRCEAKNQCESGCGEAMEEMAIFTRVLEATRANLKVMRRLREVSTAQLEYDTPTVSVNASSESDEHGDH
jgi:hypothetical protein